MKIELQNDEIEEALVAYVAGQGIDIADKEISVDMTAGRGPNGYTASITLIRVPAVRITTITTTESEEQEEEEAEVPPSTKLGFGNAVD